MVFIQGGRALVRSQISRIPYHGQNMKIAFCAILKPSDDEAEVAKTLLENVAPYVDKMFITITGHNQRCADLCKMWNADVSYFNWVNDFARARNFNFSQVPKEYDYILWGDADDAFRGLENLRTTMEKNPADAYILHYLYAFDEYKNPVVVHPKTQVIKNDGSFSWHGCIHEDLQPTREVSTYFLKGIERLHLSNDVRFESAKERNLKVAELALKETPDDPRTFWNLGNALKALNKNEEALDAFNKFLKTSESDQEKYIVRLRMAEVYWQDGDKNKGLEMAQFAIGLLPEYPDAYHLAGSILFEMKEYHRAESMYKLGLVRKPPYYKILVYNPRDYDYTPLMNLAKVYINMSLPTLALECLKGCAKIMPSDERTKRLIKIIEKESAESEKIIKTVSKLKKIKDKEKLAKELDKIPDKHKSNPWVCNLRNENFIKTESTGRDLVIYCGQSAEEWTPETAGVGGSEEAVIELSKRLANRGWNVTVYNTCGYKEHLFGKVLFRPFWSWNVRDKQDVVIIWRHPRSLDYPINCKNIYLDLHDCISDGEFIQSRIDKLKGIFVKSKFHRSLYPNIPDKYFTIVPNGIDVERFSNVNFEAKDKNLLINTSAPDRGLVSLAKTFKKIKEKHPQLRCVWAYGWNTFDQYWMGNIKQQEWKRQVIELLKDAGVEELGRLSYEDVSKLYKQGNILLYPTNFAEIDCITVTKALACGCIPVTTDFAAVGEKQAGGGYFVHSPLTKDNWCPPYKRDFSMPDEEVEQVVKHLGEALKWDLSDDRRFKMRDFALNNYSWELVADIWNKTLLN